MRQERVGQKDDLLFGLPRIHRMNGEQVGRQLAGLGFATFADGDARIDADERVVQPGRRFDDFPAVSAVEARVGGQKSLQQRGAAAHHPDHDDRRNHALLENLRVPADPLLRAQSHPQAVHDARSQDEHADGVEVGGRVVGQQHLQRMLEFRWAPVGQRFLALGVGEHGGQVESLGSHAIRTSDAG